MDIDYLFQEFIREKTLLVNLSPKTITSYKEAYKKFRTLYEGDTIDKTALDEFVVKMKKGGMSPGGINNYARSMNSFFSWLLEKGHIPEPLKIKLLKETKTLIRPFTDEHIKAILNYDPQGPIETRTHAVLVTILDTGLRISEVLKVKLSQVDFKERFISVMGKGASERLVPMSPALKGFLSAYAKKRMHKKSAYLFPTKAGTSIQKDNFSRHRKLLCRNLKIEGVRVSPHTLRHTFAYQYAKEITRRTGSAENGLLYLQRQMGHADVTTTRMYVDVRPEDLRELP